MKNKIFLTILVSILSFQIQAAECKGDEPITAMNMNSTYIQFNEKIDIDLKSKSMDSIYFSSGNINSRIPWTGRYIQLLAVDNPQGKIYSISQFTENHGFALKEKVDYLPTIQLVIYRAPFDYRKKPISIDSLKYTLGSNVIVHADCK